MKKILFAACILLICCLSHTKAQTQMSMATIDTTLAKPAQSAPPVYGMLRYDSILQSMPEYMAMKIRVKQLRDKYEREANYNELNFKRMFTDFMQGQKDFPQNILLKRQRDLQDALEKGIGFPPSGRQPRESCRGRYARAHPSDARRCHRCRRRREKLPIYHQPRQQSYALRAPLSL